jgi:hypothetical protein
VAEVSSRALYPLISVSTKPGVKPKRRIMKRTLVNLM